MHWLLALAALSNTASAAGDGVLYYTGHSGFASSSYFPPSHLEDVIENEECGTFTETSTWPSDLSPYRMIVLMIPSNSWSASEITQLQDFIADDGVLVAVGDSSGYDSAHVTPMNNLMTSLGVTSSFQTAAIDSGCSGNQAPAATSHALTTDISSTGIQFGWSSDLTVSASATELFTGPSGQALAAVEGQVVLISDINVFIDDCSLNNDNRQFFKNMYHHGTSLDSCDMDGDGYDAGHCGGADCDDCDAASSTGGTYYLDADGDSYGSSTSMASCSLPSGYVTTTGDCNDTDSAIYPGASEYCNGIDDDCDGSTDEGVPVDASTWYADTDGDGFGSSAVSTMACSAPTGFGTDSSDCNDTDSSIFPGATETCNGIDDDCDGTTDESDAVDVSTWYADTDGDGFGDSASTTLACSQPTGFGSDATDCDDTDSAVNPGATETCNGTDDDCDGTTDEADAVDALTWYADLDGDSYGDPASSTDACTQPSGFLADATDCDDTDSAVHPGATETCNSIDDDCDGTTDEADAIDALTWYADSDGDSYGDPASTTDACTQPSGYLADATDCDDTDSAVHPGASETCNSIDDDCDGTTDEDSAVDALTWFADDDGDGYGDSASTTLACAQPSGFGTDATDCDDTDSAVHPGATELCNSIDDNCDGTVDEASALDALTWYADSDGDGFGDSASTTLSCDQPTGFGTDATDCDDTDSAVNPGAAELCNSIDDDCDGTTDEADAIDALTWYADSDGDSYGDATSTSNACTQPTGYLADATDCDDTDSAVHPGASETCNSIDDNCDGTVDEDSAVDALTWYADSDGDSYGDAASTTLACDQPIGFGTDATDCDDTDSAVYPGATELCNSIDDNCDGTVDEASAVDALTWYADSDGDGFGDSASTTLACDQPTGFGTDATDCDDTDSAVHPGATELCNSIDDDCDGTTDEPDAADALTWYADDDGDGYGDLASTTLACTQPTGFGTDDTDCDDTDSAVHPGATELCNSIDDNCDGTVDEATATDAVDWYADTDGDGYGDAATTERACAQPSGYETDATDCDDSDSAVHPGADEYCNSIDDNCDGTVDEATALDVLTWYADTDGDSYGDSASTTEACDQPSGYLSDDTDCDDTSASVNPGADEYCNSIDDNCDGTVDEDSAVDALTWYADTDGDAYGDALVTYAACAQPSGYESDNTDCDDTDATIYPGASETAYDGVDNDCDGLDAPDDDLDGFETAWNDGDDCDDSDPMSYPGAVELADGIDNDCDGIVDEDTEYADMDGDGFAPAGGDCDDTSSLVHPAATETADGVDEDCDGTIDEGTEVYDDDGDGLSEVDGDCDDAEATTSPLEAEVDGDGVDNDCDGIIDDGRFDNDVDGVLASAGDCDDDDPSVYPDAPELADGLDNDCDGIIDEGTELYDDDGDGVTEAEGDCDDTSADTLPGAPEAVDGRDNNCDGRVDEGTEVYDDDGDGWSEVDGDCDDTDAELWPGAEEAADGIDNNCNDLIDEYTADVDTDGDGYTPAEGDCDDTDGWASPDGVEVCDGIDNNCDGVVDEHLECGGDPLAEDTGGDTSKGHGGCSTAGGSGGYGWLALGALGVLAARRRRWAGLALATTTAACGGVENKVSLHRAELEADPVVDLAEVGVGETVVAELNLYAVGTGDVELDTIESDHPAFVAEGWPDLLEEGEMATVQVVYSPDVAAWDAATLTIKGDMADGDVTSVVRARAGLRGLTALPGRLDYGPVAGGASLDRMVDIGNHGDLPDTLVAATVSSPDFEVTGLDGAVLHAGEHQALWVTVTPSTEDAVSATLVLEFEHAPPIEVPLGVNDCEAGPAAAYDQDGDGVASCAGDCDDTDPAVGPGAAEVANGVDDNCDGTVDEHTTGHDDDGDGWSEADGDCDDANPETSPDAEEVYGDGIDNDCDDVVDDGTVDPDGDGFAATGGDCAPEDAAIHPGATEVENGVDDDCDGIIDEGTSAYDDDGDGYSESAGDCNDHEATTYPGATELEDRIDNDCDGAIDEGTTWADDDGDGWTEAAGDCDDADSTVFPAAQEVTGDGIDNNCDGTTL